MKYVENLIHETRNYDCVTCPFISVVQSEGVL